MTYQNFLEVILEQRRMEREVSKAYDMKIDLMDFVDAYSSITRVLLTEIYGKEGYDWYSWFCWESDYGEKDWSSVTKVGMNPDGSYVQLEQTEMTHGATDEKNNPICYSFESLWEYLEANHLQTK